MAIDKSLRALNRYTCRKVLELLRRGPKSVAEIHSRMNMGTRASVSQALALLLDAGLVSRSREGRNHFYEIRPAAFAGLVSYLEGFQNGSERLQTRRSSTKASARRTGAAQ